MKLLGALNASRARGWLSAESHLRDLGAEGRIDLAKFFTLAGESKPLFVWLQQHEQQIDWRKIRDKATAAALAVKATNVIGVVAEVSADGTYYRAQSFTVQIPRERDLSGPCVMSDTTTTCALLHSWHAKKLRSV